MQPLRLSCAQGRRGPDSTATLAAGGHAVAGAAGAAAACTDARGNTLPNNAAMAGVRVYVQGVGSSASLGTPRLGTHQALVVTL